MTVQIDSHFIDQSESFAHAVLELVHRVVMDEAQVDLATGCVQHPKTHVRWLGGVWRVKVIVWQYAHGPLGEGLLLFRTCATLGCQAAAHHVARSPREHGLWLGTNGWHHRQSPPAA